LFYLTLCNYTQAVCPEESKAIFLLSWRLPENGDLKGMEISFVSCLQPSVPVFCWMEQVFWLCVWLLQAAYTTAVVVGLTSSTLWTKVAMVISLAFLSLSRNHYLTPWSCCPLKTSGHQTTVQF
jgi:hypothetical protein